MQLRMPALTVPSGSVWQINEGGTAEYSVPLEGLEFILFLGGKLCLRLKLL